MAPPLVDGLMAAEVWVRDANLSTVAQLDQFGGLKATLPVNGAGGWTLQLPATGSASLLGEVDAGLRVDVDGVRLFGGPVTSWERRSDGTVDVAGVSDWDVLNGLLVAPTSGDTDDRTGVAETVALGYLAANLGRLGVAYTTAGSDGGGASGAWTGGWSTKLGDLVREILDPSGLICTVTDSGAALDVDVVGPRDRSAEVRFASDLGTVSTWARSLARRKADVAVVSGATVTRTVGSGLAWVRETHVSQPSTDDTDTLDAAGGEALDDGRARDTVMVETVDTEAFGFGDWMLGDVVSLRVPGADVTVQVRQVVFEDGRVKPVLSDVRVAAPLTSLDRLARVEREVSRISLGV